ncbi:hypothetical protein BC835DRAFT_312822 [Cytidiella melzeri]|nr:hypothetical protein BC835DRAFT_312822 [Cytidiella melzeri]
MVNPGVIPLALLSAALVIGGLSMFYLTRRIARVRLEQEIERTLQARLEAERVERDRPPLVDVYIQQPDKGLVVDFDGLLWTDVLPLGVRLNEGRCCPHPHRVVENRPGYDKRSLVDGNVLEVSVGIAMPRPSSQADLDMIAPLASFEYCIGTSETVVCTLLGARQRLVGIN